jgi:glc operon protein GlcG
MDTKPRLSFDQVQRAMAAMLDKATRQPDHPVALALVDEVGNVISAARMDPCRALPQRMALRKAYTAALSGQETLAYAERLQSQGRTVAEMGDLNLAAVHGGLVVRHPDSGAIRGGIGVSGLTAPEEEDIARLGLQALGLSRHSHPGGERLCQSGSG